MDEITAANHEFPVKIVESHYETGILTLRAEKDVLVSVRCPFDVYSGGVVMNFSEADASALTKLTGMNIQSISTREANQYPDLLIKLEDNIEIRARPLSAGEEMWFVDIPGVAFISP